MGKSKCHAIPTKLPEGCKNLPNRVNNILLLYKDKRYYAIDGSLKEYFFKMYKENPETAFENALEEKIITDVTDTLKFSNIKTK